MYAAETNGDHAKSNAEEGISEEIVQKVILLLIQDSEATHLVCNDASYLMIFINIKVYVNDKSSILFGFYECLILYISSNIYNMLNDRR